ncbi:MAG: hypothetical protein M1839_004121 [Geoglossum umbratile]|nr:MAG: hypothetical protein M1839_004121 [Geoglossum umbratile]
MSRTKRDPFEVLDDLCFREVINRLEVNDVVRCSGVNSIWRSRIQYCITPAVILERFPHDPPVPQRKIESSRGSQTWLAFLRLAYRESAMAAGKATWVRKYSNVKLYYVAGDHMVWIPNRNGNIHWQHLIGSGNNGMEIGPVREMDLFPDSSPMLRMDMKYLICNANGVVFAMGLIHELKPTALSSGPYFRFWVFSMPDWVLKWKLDITALAGSPIPIAIGDSRIYLLHHLYQAVQHAFVTFFINAIDIHTGETLYLTSLPACPRVFSEPRYFKLMPIGGRDYILWLGPAEYNYSILDGETGAIVHRLKFSDNGFRGLAVGVESGGEGFSVAHWAVLNGQYVVLRSFYAGPDRNFELIWTQLLADEKGYLNCHSYCPYGIRVDASAAHRNATIFSIKTYADSLQSFEGGKYTPYTVNLINSRKDITLPPFFPIRSGSNRREAPKRVPFVWHKPPGFATSWPRSFDRSRFGYELIGSRRDLYIFDFSAPF